VLALAIALAIDPSAELAPRQELDPVGTPPAPPPLPPATDGAARDGAARDGAAPDGAASTWSARASLGASVAFGIAPHPVLGPSALLAFRRDDAAALQEVGLGFVFRTGAPELVRGARADFDFYAARATLCVRGIELATPLYAAPCFVFEAGAVTGVGSNLPVTSRVTRFWAAAAALVRLEQALPAGFFVTLEGGAVLPLTRYRFVFRNPDTGVHDVPAVTAEAGLHVGVGF
jgi:hypothetical protein